MAMIQTYDETLERFMEETGVQLPRFTDPAHPEFAACIGVANDGQGWSFLTARTVSQLIRDEDTGEDALWWTGIRTKSKVGRVVRKLFLSAHMPEPKGPAIDALVRKWEVFNRPGREYTFKIVQGDDIKYYYLEDQYLSRADSLGGSCMRHDYCQDYLNIYSENRQCKLAVLLQAGKVAARCLVWLGKYYDRLYSINHYTEDLLRTRCEEEAGLIPCWRSGIGRLSIEVDQADYEFYPYMDTFCYIDREANLIMNAAPADGPYIFAQFLDGSYRSFNDCSCSSCGASIAEDRAVWINDDPHCRDCSVYSEYYGEYIERDEAVYCEMEDSYLLGEDVTELYDGTYTHNDNAIELYNGEYAHHEDDDLLELYNGEYALDGDRDIVELHDGQYAHNDDEDIIEMDDGEWAFKDDVDWTDDGRVFLAHDTIRIWDGRRVHIDEAVSTYNGFLIHVDEAQLLNDGKWAWKNDLVALYETATPDERLALLLLFKTDLDRAGRFNKEGNA